MLKNKEIEAEADRKRGPDPKRNSFSSCPSHTPHVYFFIFVKSTRHPPCISSLLSNLPHCGTPSFHFNCNLLSLSTKTSTILLLHCELLNHHALSLDSPSFRHFP